MTSAAAASRGSSKPSRGYHPNLCRKLSALNEDVSPTAKIVMSSVASAWLFSDASRKRATAVIKSGYRVAGSSDLGNDRADGMQWKRCFTNVD
ncbi:hypothetical protein OKW45_000152 [Paraburkholderia sp. WSM4175]